MATRDLPDLKDPNLVVAYRLTRGRRWRFRSDLAKLLTERQKVTGAELNVTLGTEKLCDIREYNLTKPCSMWDLDLDTTLHTTFREHIHYTIEESRTPAGKTFNIIYAFIMTLFAIFEVVFTVSYIDAHKTLLWIYTAEVVLRFLVSPSMKIFFKNIFNLIDLVVVIPYVLARSGAFSETATPFLQICANLRPLFRLIKVSMSLQSIRLLTRTIELTVPALVFPIFSLLGLVVTVGNIQFVSELPTERGVKQTYVTLWEAAWVLVYTIATVGYGEAPVTARGQYVAAGIIVLGIIYLAIPISVVGFFFDTQFKQRELLFITDEIKRRLRHLGLSENDVRLTFRMMDFDEDGFLSQSDILKVFQVTGIKATSGTLNGFLKHFEASDQGQISYKQFLRGLRGCTVIPSHTLYLATHTAVRDHRMPRDEAGAYVDDGKGTDVTWF